MRKPVRGGNVRLTSGFGYRRHPLHGDRRMHTGADWAAPTGHTNPRSRPRRHRSCKAQGRLWQLRAHQAREWLPDRLRAHAAFRAESHGPAPRSGRVRSSAMSAPQASPPAPPPLRDPRQQALRRPDQDQRATRPQTATRRNWLPSSVNAPA